MASVAMVVTNACSPDPRVLRSAKVLAAAGHDVTIHAFDRNQASKMSESKDGFRIMRYHIGSFSYGAKWSTVKGKRAFNKTVTSTLLANPPHCLYCHDADTLAIGVRVANKTGARLVYDMHDLHHTWALMGRSRSLLRRAVAWTMEQSALRRARRADLVVTSSGKRVNGVHNGFKEYLGGNGITSMVVENRPNVQRDVQKTLKKEGWTVAYLGRVRELESFEWLIKAIEHMPPNQRPDLKVAGDGVAADAVHHLLLTEASRLGINLQLSAGFEEHDLPELIADVDVMYAMYEPQRGNILQGALPVKMFDAASFGVPTVVNADCLMGEICQEEDLGLPAAWGDAESISAALLSLRGTIVEPSDQGLNQQKKLIAAVESLL
jgi:glycosyltransferase involved in cell wall biosynthesis